LQQLQALWAPVPPAPATSAEADEHVLLLHPGVPAPAALADALRHMGARVTTAGDMSTAEGITRIVLCCPPLDGPHALAPFLAEHLLPLARSAECLPGLRRVLLLTPEALPVGAPPRHPALAAAWGFARSWQAEQPGLPLACADTDLDAASLTAVAADLLHGTGEERAYRHGQRHARSLQAATLPDGLPPVQADRSYLVTGGQGDIGRQLARWLVAHGARHLAVLSRRPPEADPFWADLAATARIVFIAADVADASQVDAAFARIAAELPPLATIFHAAGLRQDATLDTLDRDRLDAVLRPKTLGAWNLFQRARALGTPLQALVCISSIAASFGSAGQAHYAAANAWLDAFAPWARAQGVPALSLAFGPWDDTGLVRQLTPRQRDDLLRRGLAFQSAEDSLNALGRQWRAGGTDLLVYAGPLPAAQHAPPRAAAANSQDSDNSLLNAVAGILRLPPQQIDLDAPLVSLGLDSLMALELRNWCKRTHQADIPAVDLLRDASVRLLAERLAPSNTPEKTPDLIAASAYQTSARGPFDSNSNSLPPQAHDAPLPLSPGQTALWYLHRMAPAAAAYHIALALRVRSAIDAQALAASLTALAQRHDMLRSVYEEGEHGPHRRVTPTGPRLARHDARGRDDAALLAQVRADYRQPFDLARGPVLRLSLHSRADDDHVLLFSLHHIAADAWSLWRLLEELRVLYAAARAGQAPDLPAPDYAFSDRVRDEVAYLSSPRAAADRAYWLHELAGELPLLQLPTDHPRPRVQSLDGASVPFSLSQDETAALTALARQENTTLYAVLLAAYHSLLHRYSGQDDILVGCPSAGRDRPEAAATIGYFVNPVVLRARFTPGLGFRALLRQLRQRLLDGMAHQDYPFPLLAEALRTPRAEGWPPVFQAAFVMQQLQPADDFARLLVPSSPPAQVDWGGLRLEFFGLPQQEGQFDLTLEMVQADGAAHGLFKYDSALWHHATMERLAGHFRALLRAIAGIAADADQPVDRLDLLPPAERHTLLHGWNATRRPYDLEQPLHRWIEAQAQRTPAAVAAECEGRSLRYAELNAAANRLAHRLRAAGAGADDLVGLCAERSLEMLVGLLGILKAGAAYVPLDPDLPPERLRLMIDDAAPKVVLAAPGALPGEAGATAWTLADACAPGLDPGNPPWPVAPQSLAYTIYTSGSTGSPKGAMNTHRGIVNRLLWMQEAFALQPGESVLQKTPFGFDVSVWEFFWPLMTGARLVFARPGGHRDAAYLAELIQVQGISTVHFVPPMLQAFLEAPQAAGCHTLRRVVCSGQELPATLQRQFFRTLPGCELHNLYGPTEAAVDVSWHRCRADDTRAFVPIGQPIANTTLYILDRLGQPVPIGLPGELHIGGVQVARGYLNRAALSAERFVPDPFGPDGGQLYRTGDLARFDGEGSIQFLGRNDFQVKIRGLRVELGEIEHALATQPGVREAVVLLREDRPGVQRLVAYCTGAAEAEALRAGLSHTLPAHCVPDDFVFLTALPLNTSGKVDRQALPAPDTAAASASPRAALGGSEAALAAIWKELLNLPDGHEPGADDNFFRLGGDSIKSTQLVFRAARQGFTFGVREVLEQPTLAALAAYRNASDAPTTTADDDGSPPPLLPMQSWFFADGAAPPHRFNQAVLLHTAQPLDASALQAALDDLVERHAALRLRFPHGAAPQPVAPAVSPWRLRQGAPSADIDPEHGPLATAWLIDSQQPALLLLAHHLAVDGVSWRILLADLETAYHARRAGQAPAFTAAAPACGAWAHALARFAASAQAESEALHWLCEDWAAARPVLPAPGTGPAHADGPACGELALELPAASTAHLPAHTLEALLLATLADALAGESRTPLRLDMEGHGRHPVDGIDGSAAVGWCTALFPALLVRDGPTLAARAAAIARQTAAIPTGGRAFGLCRTHSPKAALRQALARIPQAELLFNYLGDLDRALPPGSLFTLAPLDPIPPGLLRDADAPPRYPLEVNAFQQGGQLRLSLRYDRRRLHADWVGQVSQRWQALLGAELSGAFALTPMQQGMLFHSLLQPASGLYLTQVSVDLHGPVDTGALHAAWNAVLQRHPVLRHAFAWRGLDAPRQMPQAHCELPWQVHDWRAVAPDRRAGALAEFLAADRQRGFDLAAAPLLRVQLLQGDAAHTMVWSHHHLLLDGRSMFLVLAEVLEIYRARLAGRAPLLAEAGDFRAFVSSLADADPAAARTYWQSQLAGVDAATPLPFLRRADEQAEGTGHDRHDYLLPQDASERLRALARHHGVSLNLLLQALLGLLLHRLSGSARVVFGATVSAALPEGKAEAGLFINTIPIAMAPPAGGELGGWLRALRQAQAKRAPFEQTALVDIQACSGVPAGQPLFDLLFLFENYAIDDSLRQPVDGLRLGAPQVLERSHFPLTLSVLPGERIALQLAYDPARYPPDAARLLLRHYQHLLALAADAPPQVPLPLDRLDPLDAELRHTVLERWNATALAVPDDWRAHLAFFAQADARPGAIAIRWHGESWSYGQLASQARQVAGVLQGRGIGAGDLVGLCVERSPRMLAGLFGILLTGAAYVPLDPGFPAERLAYMLDDAQARLCLSESGVDAALRQRLAATAPVLLLDGLPDAPAPSWTEPPVPDAQAPMYVIYTSGSTGRPKGVVLPHGAVANFLASMARNPGLDASDRLLAVTTLSFDIAVLELLLPLGLGACVVLADRAEAVDPRRLMRLLDDEAISAMQATPATWRMLLAAGWQGRPELKALCGGEALPADLGQALLRGCAEVWNMYGPTETTVWSAVHRLTPGSGQGVEPIGRPIANTRLYVLDALLRPVPPGAVGELCIAGAGVALGYHRRPELTAERFVPDPFATHPGERMYRTGDLARFRPDGVAEFLGRADQQVKLRGFRIEIGEIESVLAGHAAVAQCAVAVRPTPQAAGGEPRLLAWYTLRPGMAAPAEGALRATLRERLPEYMVPALFICLPALPLTPNGKIDRQALPEPADAPTAAFAPGTMGDPLHAQLAAIWSELLGRPAPPASESFFNLGGNSLQLVTLQTRIARDLGLELDIVDLFRHPTLGTQAELVKTRQAQTTVPASPSPRTHQADARQHQAALRREARTRPPR
jgi:amino acid adenylation domain-containing protein/non-ribosomal peptide synthase protein (TIGR01720 family)